MFLHAIYFFKKLLQTSHMTLKPACKTQSFVKIVIFFINSEFSEYSLFVRYVDFKILAAEVVLASNASLSTEVQNKGLNIHAKSTREKLRESSTRVAVSIQYRTSNPAGITTSARAITLARKRSGKQAAIDPAIA